MAQRKNGQDVVPQIRKYLADHNLTVRELAAILNFKSIDAAFRLLRYENGPSLKTARIIAGLIGTSIDFVLLDFERGVRQRKRKAA